ncbi:hypothetical protein N7492_000152 [Penicillium capsulatum]|uniref:Uncharacterized protein n=1 Tax=Penicillium capsulatum TaxID=69766 RepID=A0A9W9IVC4_9EURO|nr:hypothetical protein N7492_000152 [Penicillium capsulatum]
MKKTASGDTAHLLRELIAREDAEKAATETDMSEALDEALQCVSCENLITEMSMSNDISRGSYITTSYPPYFLHRCTRDDNISPLTPTPLENDQSYWNCMSPIQRQRYYQLVETILNEELQKPVRLDAERAVLFAHYQVDFHIRQHHLARRGVLTMCRNTSDMHQLRKWQWNMAEIDAVTKHTTVKTWPKGSRQLGWPNDGNLEMAHQTHMWRKSWRARRKRVEAVRAKWAIIMEERRRQREMLKLKELATVTVRLYCGGELRDVRELQRTRCRVPLPIKEPGTRSSAF